MFKRPANVRSARIFQTSLIAALISFGIYFDHASSVAPAPAESVAVLHGDLVRAMASPDVRHIAQWAVDSRDHANLPFVVVDKAQARLFSFDAQGRFRGSAPVLLGASRGDSSSVPATPAGRFVSDSWRSAQADGIVWTNADTTLALHGVPSLASPGRGAQRLASRSLEDKRISDGSLHVAADFYDEHLSLLRHQPGVAYVLPEHLPLHLVFSSYELEHWPRGHIAQSPRLQGARRPS